MQHIDEALLHEYLDRQGESDEQLARVESHLAECSACRARLDDAAALRSSAREILRAAAPVSRPVQSFEEMMASRVARANAAAGVTTAAVTPAETPATAVATRRRLRSMPLAWAATLLMAVGGTWMASSLTRTPKTTAARLDSPAATAPPASAAPIENGTLARSAGIDAAGGAAGSAATRPGREARRDAVTSERAEVTPSVAQAAPPPPSSLGAASNAAAAGAVAAAPPAPAPVALAEADFAARKSVAAAPDSAVDLLRSGDWRATSQAEALVILRGDMIRAHGLDVIDFAAARDAQSPVRVRVRQRNAQGDTVTVIQSPPPVTAPKAGAMLQEAARARAPSALRDAALSKTLGRGKTGDGQSYVTLRFDDRVAAITGSSDAAVNAAAVLLRLMSAEVR